MTNNPDSQTDMKWVRFWGGKLQDRVLLPKGRFESFEQLKKLMLSGSNDQSVVWLMDSTLISYQCTPTVLDSVQNRYLAAGTNVPQYRIIVVIDMTFELSIHATSYMEAFGILNDMTCYVDFSSQFRGFMLDEANSVPSFLLDAIMEKVQSVRMFNATFEAESAQVLATSGRNTAIHLANCKFDDAGENVFLKAMTEKPDKVLGLGTLAMYGTCPFHSDQALISLLHANALHGLASDVLHSLDSEELLDALSNSHGLEFLTLHPSSFVSEDAYVRFVNSVHLPSLADLVIDNRYCEYVPFPPEILDKHSLTLRAFRICDASLNEEDWVNILQQLQQCNKLSFVGIENTTWSTIQADTAASMFALFLKSKPNLRKLDVEGSFDEDVWNQYCVPVLQHHQCQENIQTLHSKDDNIRGALVAKAMGMAFTNKPSNIYTLLKDNLDLLDSSLAQKVVGEHSTLRMMLNGE